jgi:hypothetical protein
MYEEIRHLRTNLGPSAVTFVPTAYSAQQLRMFDKGIPSGHKCAHPRRCANNHVMRRASGRSRKSARHRCCRGLFCHIAFSAWRPGLAEFRKMHQMKAANRRHSAHDKAPRGRETSSCEGPFSEFLLGGLTFLRLVLDVAVVCIDAIWLGKENSHYHLERLLRAGTASLASRNHAAIGSAGSGRLPVETHENTTRRVAVA